MARQNVKLLEFTMMINAFKAKMYSIVKKTNKRWRLCG